MEVICRLCAEISSADDIICSIEDNDLNIRQKLIDCCRWDELHHATIDVYPKSICKVCYGRLELCWNFSKSVSRAQFKIFQYVASGGDMELLQVQPEVKEEAETCFAESLPIVNPLENVVVKMEDEVYPLESHIDINPLDPSPFDSHSVESSFKATVKPIGSRTRATNPIDSTLDDILATSTAVKKPKPPKQQEIEEKSQTLNMDSDNDDFFGSTASLSSHEDASLSSHADNNKTTIDAVPSTSAANPSNANQMKRAFASKRISAPEFLELTKNGCNPDGSINAATIERLHLVNWSLLQEICWVCKFLATDRKMLRLHTRSDHPGVDVRTICTLCPNKSYSSRYPLMRHTQSEHFPYLVFCCHKCEILFHGKKALKQHKCAGPEDNKSSFICEFCGTVLKNAGNLKLHMETHLPKSERQNFQCYLCKESGFLKRGLERHMKKLHITVVRKEHPCSHCEFKSTSKSSLRRHTMIHTNTYLYTCTYCGKGFRDKGGLVIHERKHTGERPYQCTVCEYRSREQPNMDKHMTQQHGISWYKNRRKPFKLKEPKSAIPKTTNIEIPHHEQAALEMQPSSSTFPFFQPPMNFWQ